VSTPPTPAVGYRPANWGQQKQLYSITCTLPPAANTGVPANNTIQLPTTYFFDAVLRVDHIQEAIGTEHPVQVGPAVVDHIYLKPYEMTLEVAISDCMQSYQSGQYSSGSSRSVSAYQQFLAIEAARVPITVATRLVTMTNMFMRVARATEDSKTFRGFRGALYFKQIIAAQVSASTTSTRPNATNTTNEGTKSPQPVTPAQTQQIESLN
jgi:hypothetical protein